MKKLATALLMSLVVLAGSAHHARAQTLLFDYVGFDYEDPNPQPSTFGEFGSGYVSQAVSYYFVVPPRNVFVSARLAF